jgi:hypothetical protein
MEKNVKYKENSSFMADYYAKAVSFQFQPGFVSITTTTSAKQNPGKCLAIKTANVALRLKIGTAWTRFSISAEDQNIMGFFFLYQSIGAICAKMRSRAADITIPAVKQDSGKAGSILIYQPAFTRYFFDWSAGEGFLRRNAYG